MMELELKDNEWDFDYCDHDRQICRAIVVDEKRNFYFVQVQRKDDFGTGTFIETAGGGKEEIETEEEAIRRELNEELGVEVDILCRLGKVSDYYNLIHRHNINHYFLCQVKSFGKSHQTDAEIQNFHLSTLKMSYQEALKEYEQCRNTKLGRLISQREIPILKKAYSFLKRRSIGKEFEDE